MVLTEECSDGKKKEQIILHLYIPPGVKPLAIQNVTHYAIEYGWVDDLHEKKVVQLNDGKVFVQESITLSNALITSCMDFAQYMGNTSYVVATHAKDSSPLAKVFTYNDGATWSVSDEFTFPFTHPSSSVTLHPCKRWLYYTINYHTINYPNKRTLKVLKANNLCIRTYGNADFDAVCAEGITTVACEDFILSEDEELVALLQPKYIEVIKSMVMLGSA